jgi:hypothetical protein
MDAKLDKIVAWAKARELCRSSSRNGEKDSFREVGLALPDSQKIVWDAACAPTTVACEWGGDIAYNVVPPNDDACAAAVHGIACDGDVSFEWTDATRAKTRAWTNCRFMSLSGTRLFYNDVTCFPPNLRVLDLADSEPNLGGIDFELLDTVCPELELVILPNEFDHYVTEHCDLWDESWTPPRFWPPPPVDHDDDDPPPAMPLQSCVNSGYLNARERSYGVYWTWGGHERKHEHEHGQGEYWAPHTVRHPHYFPMWRTTLDGPQRIAAAVAAFPGIDDDVVGP